MKLDLYKSHHSATAPKEVYERKDLHKICILGLSEVFRAEGKMRYFGQKKAFAKAVMEVLGEISLSLG